MEIYLDNSATTKIRPEVMEEIMDVYVNNYGNPSSLHRKGLQIEKKIDSSRKSAARVINAKAEEIYFTSGGTESNNIAIFGHLSNIDNSDVKKNIITTKIEHPSVYNIYKHFEENLQVNYLDTDEKGNINMADLYEFINENTLLVSIILVNNEIGTVQNLNKIVETVKKKNKRTT